LPNTFLKYEDYNRMNTKSIVAVVKKPKASKAVVKKPKAAKAAVKKPKSAKAVVKKPKIAPKAAVKKPKAAKTAKAAPKAVVKKPKAAKTAKAVVEKPKRGGAGSGFFKSMTGMFRLRRTSNAIVPTPSRLTPVIKYTPVVEEQQKAPIEKCIRPSSPSILLKKILDDYKTLFVDKIIPNEFTVYDLLDLIENIANNLNKFFEDFLHFYPIIIFKVDTSRDRGYYYDYYKTFLRFQDKFVKINSTTRYYIQHLAVKYSNRYEFRDTIFPKYSLSREHLSDFDDGSKFLDTSKVVYNGILDGTQKGMKEYERSRLNFFKFKYVLELKDYETMSDDKNPLTLYKDCRLIFGDSFYLGEIGYFNRDIVVKLYEVLQDFFSYIEFMKIDPELEQKTNPEIIVLCREYIEDAKKTANTNLVALNKLYEKLKLGMKNIDKRQPSGYLEGYRFRHTETGYV
jgi:hypothetical protein